MSSAAAASPDDDAAPASQYSAGDSSWLTQGEIVFVTLLSFVVLLALVLGVYTVCHQRGEGATAPKSDLPRGPETLVDIEVTDVSPDGEQGKLLAREHPDQDQDSSSSPSGSGRRPRRRSSPSHDGGRRPVAEGGGGHVSSRYKRAAIDHMNQISQTGRH